MDRTKDKKEWTRFWWRDELFSAVPSEMKGGCKRRSFSEEKDGEETLASLAACWGLTAAAWATTDWTQWGKKGVGVSKHGISLLSLSASVRSISFPLLHLCVTVNMSPKQVANDKYDKSIWQIHLMNIYFKWLNRFVSFTYLTGLPDMSPGHCFGYPEFIFGKFYQYWNFSLFDTVLMRFNIDLI